MTRNEAGTAIDPYTSSATLRRAHLDLKQNASSTTAQDMGDFIARACASGAFIHDGNERRMAQAIIDYWTTELAGSPGAGSAGNLPAMLAPFDAEQAVHTPEQPFAAEPERDKRARDMIRLAATARLWKDAKNGAGFLLVGDAIKQAARFRDLDPDIDKLVNASQKAVTRKLRNTILFSLGSVLLAIVAIWFAVNWTFPYLIQSEIKVLSGLSDSKAKQRSLRRIAFYEIFTPIGVISDINFTVITVPKLSDLRGLKLYGVDFGKSVFEDVIFKDAELPNSSFVESTITGTDFENARLRYSRFKAAKINSTSFAGAELYRTEFDEATLNDVDFSGADLHLASFRNAEFDVKSEEHFKKAAWWLARGWSSKNLNKLLRLRVDPTAFEKSTAFQKEIGEVKLRFDGSEAGTLERALALNYFAWTHATWGIKLNKASNGPNTSQKGCQAEKNELPAYALDAALQAICIVDKFRKNATDADLDKINNIYANYQDTLGYIYLQIGKPSDALTNLGEAAKVLTDRGGVKFRYSVAQYASQHDKEAMKNLKISMGKDYNYVPSSELQLLKQYIAGTKFYDCIYEFIDNRGLKPSDWPSNSVSACAR